MREQAGKARRFPLEISSYGAVIPFGEGEEQTKSQAPADKHGEKLSGVSEEMPQHRGTKPVWLQTF